MRTSVAEPPPGQPEKHVFKSGRLHLYLLDRHTLRLSALKQRHHRLFDARRIDADTLGPRLHVAHTGQQSERRDIQRLATRSRDRVLGNDLPSTNLQPGPTPR